VANFAHQHQITLIEIFNIIANSPSTKAFDDQGQPKFRMVMIGVLKIVVFRYVKFNGGI
jgi:hypothetical protein